MFAGQFFVEPSQFSATSHTPPEAHRSIGGEFGTSTQNAPGAIASQRARAHEHRTTFESQGFGAHTPEPNFTVGGGSSNVNVVTPEGKSCTLHVA